MPLTLYAVSDGPPSLAVRMGLKALGLDYKHISVDFGLGEHMTDEFAQVRKAVHEDTWDKVGMIFRKIRKSKYRCWTTTVSTWVKGIGIETCNQGCLTVKYANINVPHNLRCVLCCLITFLASAAFLLQN